MGRHYLLSVYLISDSILRRILQGGAYIIQQIIKIPLRDDKYRVFANIKRYAYPKSKVPSSRFQQES
jgi:hypothetical protein